MDNLFGVEIHNMVSKLLLLMAEHNSVVLGVGRAHTGTGLGLLALSSTGHSSQWYYWCKLLMAKTCDVATMNS